MAKALAEETGLPQARVKALLQRVFDGMIETLASEGRIELRSFGVFEVRRRRPRRARNPHTGAEVTLPERLVVTFKPGLAMRRRVLGWEAVQATPGPTGSEVRAVAAEVRGPAGGSPLPLPPQEPATPAAAVAAVGEDEEPGETQAQLV
jgi:nucleoid DNA-binding protein